VCMRTYLAWVRTSVAPLAAAAALVQLVLSLPPRSSLLRTAFSCSGYWT
jgi:uncharacterized membrane protein YidH (DUF202 family)